MENITLQDIFEEVRLLRTQLSSRTNSYSSESIDELAKALAAAQGEYKPVSFNRENPFFKSGYADLDAIIKSVRGALAAHGLSFIQLLCQDENDKTYLHSKILHESGQWIESRSPIRVPDQVKIQEYGSIISYHKRYAASALLGVSVSADPSDDDGEAAVEEIRTTAKEKRTINTPYKPTVEGYKKINEFQLKELERELDAMGDVPEKQEIINKIFEAFHISTLADLPESRYYSVKDRIIKNKNVLTR